MPDIAIPVFGYKNHIVIYRAYGFIRSSSVTDAALHDGKVLRQLVTGDNLATGVWADSAYRSKANEAWLAGKGRVSRIHRKKPPGRAMPKATAWANACKSVVRAHVKHVFAHRKDRMGLFVRTIGLKPDGGQDRPRQPGLQSPASESSMSARPPWHESARIAPKRSAENETADDCGRQHRRSQRKSDTTPRASSNLPVVGGLQVF